MTNDEASVATGEDTSTTIGYKKALPKQIAIVNDTDRQNLTNYLFCRIQHHKCRSCTFTAFYNRVIFDC